MTKILGLVHRKIRGIHLLILDTTVPLMYSVTWIILLFIAMASILYCGFRKLSETIKSKAWFRLGHAILGRMSRNDIEIEWNICCFISLVSSKLLTVTKWTGKIILNLCIYFWNLICATQRIPNNYRPNFPRNCPCCRKRHLCLNRTCAIFTLNVFASDVFLFNSYLVRT